MKKLLFLIVLSTLSYSQSANTVTKKGSGAPTGTCTPIQIYQDTTNGNTYFCPKGVWALTGGGTGQQSPSFTWYVDPNNGSDSNSCNTKTTPCKTASAIASKVGYVSGDSIGLLENGSWVEMLPVVSGLLEYHRSSSLAAPACSLLTSWLDESGNANHIVSAVAGGPAYNTFTLTGKPGVFLGAAGTGILPCIAPALTAALNLPPSLSVATNSMTALAILEPLSQNDLGALFQFGTAGDLNLLINSPNPGKLGINSAAGNTFTTNQAPLSVEPLLTGWTISNSSSKVWTDDVGAQAGTPGVTSTTTTGGVLGALTAFAGFYSYANYYEVMIYNRALTQAEMTLLANYRKRAYGISQNNNGYYQGISMGDSLTDGPASALYDAKGYVLQSKINNPYWKILNLGFSGRACNLLTSGSGFLSSTFIINYVGLWCGGNNLHVGDSAATILSQIATVVTALRTAATSASAPMIIITATVPPCSSCNDTVRATLNTALLANAGGIYGDVISGQGVDPIIGVNGANSNTFYYASLDHLNTVGQSIIANKYMYAALQLSPTGVVLNAGPPVAATCGTVSNSSKNNSGTIVSATTGSCASTITFVGPAAPIGWNCSISNSTTANLIRQTGSTTTTATFTGVTVSGDVLLYSCTPQ